MIGGLIYAIGGFIEALIGLRIVFELFGANPASQLVGFVYSWSTPFVAPFAGIFGQSATVAPTGVTTTGVIDWTAIVALIVIGLVLSLIGRAFVHHRPVAYS